MNSIKIGSFNVDNLSRNAKNEKTRLDNIASIIKENDLDIVTMQEVLGEGDILEGSNIDNVSGQALAMDYSLKMRLGSRWETDWKAPKIREKEYQTKESDRRGEGYAYLWNTDRIEIPLNDKGEEQLPKIWENYRINIESGMIHLKRDPCYGRFVVKNTNIEIRLISTHIIWKDSTKYAEHLRKNEFKILAGQIYPRVNEYYKDIKYRTAYTILLGDYNLNLDSSDVESSARVKDIICFDERGKETEEGSEFCKIYTLQHERSTINGDNTGLASNYDHFSYNDDVKRIVSGDGARTIKAVDDLFGTVEDKYERYKKEVSDHLPIIIELGF